jgi:hypothetical protein
MMNKKSTIVLSILLLSSAVFAQYRIDERPGLNLRIGPELAFPSGKLNNTQGLGLGLTALLDIPVHNRLSLVFQTGFTSFSGDVIPASPQSRFRRATVLPVRAGIHYRLSPVFYGGLQLGQSSVRYLGASEGGFSHALGVGYFRRRLDLGLRWDRQYAHGGLSSFHLKAAYVLRLGRSRNR